MYALFILMQPTYNYNGDWHFFQKGRRTACGDARGAWSVDSCRGGRHWGVGEAARVTVRTQQVARERQGPCPLNYCRQLLCQQHDGHNGADDDYVANDNGDDVLWVEVGPGNERSVEEAEAQGEKGDAKGRGLQVDVLY